MYTVTLVEGQSNEIPGGLLSTVKRTFVNRHVQLCKTNRTYLRGTTCDVMTPDILPAWYMCESISKPFLAELVS